MDNSNQLAFSESCIEGLEEEKGHLSKTFWSHKEKVKCMIIQAKRVLSHYALNWSEMEQVGLYEALQEYLVQYYQDDEEGAFWCKGWINLFEYL